jgi:hypothetical protein
MRSPFSVIVRKFTHHRNFVWKHFQICSKCSLHWAMRHSIPMSCPPCCFARTALDHHTKCCHSWHLSSSHSLPLQNF